MLFKFQVNDIMIERDINRDELKELNEFLRVKTRNLFNHEESVLQRQGKAPKNYYQGGFASSNCRAYDDYENSRTIYRIYSCGFCGFIETVLPKALKEQPELFKNDAPHIIEFLNKISRYADFNKTAIDYSDYLSKETFVYIVIKEKGQLNNNNSSLKI